VLDVFRGQQLRQLGVDCLQLSELADIESSCASTAPSSFLVRISASITRIVPESPKASSPFAISPVKLLARAGNPTTT
jgi:hypothetical protein